ncbi:17696_t:CDS:2 [Entrophospora sp. SA101]|nr:17696_t:CDS:2 [Entrophospora sp. SA101]
MIIFESYQKKKRGGGCQPANEANQTKVYGVMPYVAPEILKSEPYTQASDVYSFGIIAYEVLSAIKRCFYGHSLLRLLSYVLDVTNHQNSLALYQKFLGSNNILSLNYVRNIFPTPGESIISELKKLQNYV